MALEKKLLLETLESFRDVTVAVVGDLLADIQINARPVGLSREAPVMVLREEDEGLLPGGAANAVANCLGLSGKAHVVGLVGDDAPGEMLCEALRSRGAATDGIVRAPGARTCTKTRVFAGDLHTVKQQVMRLDHVPADRMTSEVETQVLAGLSQAGEVADAWLISDYDGDLFCDAVVARINSLAAAGITVIDSHQRLERFRRATCATPNEGEAALASGIDITDDESASRAARRIRESMDTDWLFLTRGNKGLMIVGRDGGLTNVPIVGSAEIVDVAGAGDTVAAVVTLSMACGADAATAGVLAAYAASVVCMKTGVAAASPEEIRAAMEEYPLPKV